tara:strand:+ start:690 stop:1469 length:780 start_codon:yes stop_codon:yes gene_type:complete
VVGFVPTMGSLHDGHLSLIKKSKQRCDLTVVSIFVNPAQFSPNEDFNSYPRSLEKDMRLLKNLNIDVLFLPNENLLYPKNYSTYVEEKMLSRGLEGESRPTFFKGVATVVIKLFNIIKPHFAYFGEKDMQQLRVIKKIVSDLNIDIQIIKGKTIREKNGLAMSSRNQYLQKKDINGLGIIYDSLNYAKKLILNGEQNGAFIKSEIKENLNSFKGLEVDYVEINCSETLEKIEIIDKSVVVSLAVFINGVRLIDNLEVKI